jgi:hypothetical protein
MRGQYRNRNQEKSQQIIQAAYEHLLANGPTNFRDLAEVAGCVPDTMRSTNTMLFNEYMRKTEKPHLFICSQGSRKSPATWSLRPRLSAVKQGDVERSSQIDDF